MPDNNNIELRSDEVQEVMNRIPPAIQRWGITIIALVVLIFVSIACFVRIPVMEECKFTIIWEDGESEPTAKIFISALALQSVLLNDTHEIRLYSDLFPKEYSNGVSVMVKSKQISLSSEDMYEASFEIPSEIKIYLSNIRLSINGTARIVVSYKTLLDSLMDNFNMDDFNGFHK